MSTTPQTIRLVIEDILHDLTGESPLRIYQSKDSLLEDCFLDSLDEVEFCCRIEEEYGFEIPDADANRLHTIGDWERYLEERVR